MKWDVDISLEEHNYNDYGVFENNLVFMKSKMVLQYNAEKRKKKEHGGNTNKKKETTRLPRNGISESNI